MKETECEIDGEGYKGIERNSDREMERVRKRD